MHTADVKNSKLFLEPPCPFVTSEQPSPLGWLARNRTAMSVCHPEQARNRAVTAMQYGISPRASKFCFLKLPIVFGYVVLFAAISKKQNRKGSPQSLIYPYKGKVTSFVIKQFFAFSREHQILSRSRLSAVLLRTVHRGQCRSKSKLLLCRCMHLAFSAKLRRVRR